MGRERSEAKGGTRGAPADASRRATLRRILACALVSAGAVAARAAAPSPTAHRSNLPLATDLAADAAASRRGKVPIFLFLDRYDCPYCERALAQYVVPMSLELPWRDRALFRQIEIDQALPLVDFDGSPSTHRAVAARYRVSLTPTVVVVDGAGRTLGAPVVGLLTADFYAAYLESAIEAGAGKLRER
jgi:thioredoxin-related protein